MKKITMFMFASCPHCKLALKCLDELKAAHPEYAAVPFEMIDERKQPDVAEMYDYYYVPTFYVDGEKRYILCPDQLHVGDTIMAGPEADIRPGNAKKFKNIPDGTLVHNIELEPGRGAKLVRSAGVSAQLMAREGKFAFVRMPSGELRKFLLECTATIGVVGNGEHENVSLGKAGKTRWLGRKGRIRAMIQNPVDHPMGGGEGTTKSHHHPCSPWGTPAKGYRTRARKPSDKFIVRRRYAK